MSVYPKISDAEARREPVAVCTVISSRGSTPRHPGSKMLVYENGAIDGSVGGGEVENRVIKEALAALADGRPRVLNYNMVDPARGDPGICGGQVDIYIEPVLPGLEVVIIGGGHVGQAVAHLAQWLDFHVVVCDDRPEFCTAEANPDADELVQTTMENLPQRIKITPRSYLILTTRGMVVDVPGLPVLLETPAAYIGIIGSKRRWTATRSALLEAGVPAEKLNRVHSPMGLELNAETPEEIAVSIMAEIIMLRNGGSGSTMKM
jgi:xanthine dehydrogenase accessory factor